MIHNLSLKMRKCYFGFDQVKYLGNIISRYGVTPYLKKLQGIERFSVPITIRSVRWFLGITSYYRCIILNFSKVTHPLAMLISPKVPFVWTAQYKKAFEHLKAGLTSVLILALYDPCKPLNLHMDASTLDLGVVLY